MPSSHNIVILGVQGSGKTTWLYRLVASFLEWRGHGRQTLARMSADELIEAARAEGVAFDTVGEAFLRRVHGEIGQTGMPRPTAVSASAPLQTIRFEFPGLGLEVVADDLPGEMLVRASHMIEHDAKADDPDGSVAGFLRQLRQRLKRCDGVLFFHPPHQSEIEAESELALRRFAAAALEVNSNQFLPVIVVFTKDDEWADTRDEHETHLHTRKLTQVAQGQAVMTRREHFTDIYWRALQDYHSSDLAHPYWAPVASLFRGGQNFTSISSARGTFAELRSPLDQVERLNRATRGFFRSTFVRNMYVAFATVVLLAAITIVTLVLIPYASTGGQTVPQLKQHDAVIRWLQDGKDKYTLETLRLGLQSVRNELELMETQLHGSTTEFSAATFLRYRNMVSTLRHFVQADPAIKPDVEQLRLHITETVGTWLERAADNQPVQELPDTWFDVAERYVNELGKYFTGFDTGEEGAPLDNIDQWATWREDWRTARMSNLRRQLLDIRAQYQRPETWLKVASGLLDGFWNRYVKFPGSAPTLDFLRIPSLRSDANDVRRAREFVQRAEAGEQDLHIRIDRLYCPNSADARFPSSHLPKVLRAEVRGYDTRALVDIQLSTTSGQTSSPRVYTPPPAADGEQPGRLTVQWRPGMPLSVVIVSSLDRSVVAFNRDLKEAAEDDAYAPPLPGMWPLHYGESGDINHGPRQLRFHIEPLELPELLTGESQG